MSGKRKTFDTIFYRFFFFLFLLRFVKQYCEARKTLLKATMKANEKQRAKARAKGLLREVFKSKAVLPYSTHNGETHTYIYTKPKFIRYFAFIGLAFDYTLEMCFGLTSFNSQNVRLQSIILVFFVILCYCNFTCNNHCCRLYHQRFC